ncbi:MAG: serine/threonine protein kinase, partial [Myxococcales bacterium]|nr:serine/threonine protein kinase [Myxococcales bacterium]
MSRPAELRTLRMGSVCPRCRREPTRADGICEQHGLYGVPPAEAENIDRAPLLGVLVEGRYALIGHIGAGGMGAVYRAHQLGIDRDVAFKILHSAAASGEVARARFRREAQVIAGLQSDHTVRVFDFGEVARGPLVGTLYMVMDLVEGFSLSERLRGGPLLVEEVGLVLAHVANSVDEAHHKGIVHRDLKPSNILLTEHQGLRRAKVIDFGIARTEDSDHTHHGNALGTPAYMAPELWPGDIELPIDGRVDVYAMGVVLYQMLTGRKPFPGRDVLKLADAHKNRPPPPLSADDPRLAMFDGVIARAMAKRPEERYPTLGAMAEDFERHRLAAEQRFGPTDTFTWTHPPMPPAAAAEPSGSSQILQGALEGATIAEPVPPGRSGGRWWPALALVAVGVSIGLTILMQTREGPAPAARVAASEAVMRAAPVEAPVEAPAATAGEG